MLASYVQEYQFKPAATNVNNLVKHNSSLTLKTFCSQLRELLPKLNKLENKVYSEIKDDYNELEIKNEINVSTNMTVDIVFNEYRLHSNRYTGVVDYKGMLTNIVDLPEKLIGVVSNKVADALKEFIFNIWHKIESQSSLSYYEEDGYIEFILFNHTERSDVKITIEF